MLASGLGVWDTLIPGRRAPIYDEVRAAILKHYRDSAGEDSPQYRAALPEPEGHANGRFEPSVAAKVFEVLVADDPLRTVWREREPVAEWSRRCTVRTRSASAGAESLRAAAAACARRDDVAARFAAARLVRRNGQTLRL